MTIYNFQQQTSSRRCSAGLMSITFALYGVHKLHTYLINNTCRYLRRWYDVFCCGKNPRGFKIQLDHQVDEAKQWFDKWWLTTNTLKIMAIVFNYQNTDKMSQISFNSRNIPCFKNFKSSKYNSTNLLPSQLTWRKL